MGRIGFLVFSALMMALPVLAVAIAQGAQAPFWFLAGDAYLYLGIAQASTGLGFSFDGLEPTNGFHPLWQVWVRLLTVALGEPLAVMWGVLASALVLLTLGVWALGTAIWRLTGSWTLALLTVPGVYFLMVGQGLGNLPVWAFLDGMEAALVFALAGLLALRIAAYPGPVQARATDHLGLGLVLALIVSARLDEALLVLAMGLVALAWPATAPRRRLVAMVLIALPSVLVVAAYVGWSLATTGLPLPVSGAAKGEGGLLGNVWVTMATLLGPMQDLRAALTDYQPERQVLLGAAFRVVQLLAPAVFAALWVWVIWRGFRPRRWAMLMVGLGAGVILKAAYNFGAVNYWHQAYWYFAVAMMATTLATALILVPIWDALVVRSRAAAPLAALALGGFAALHASLWGAGLLTQPRHAVQAQFWAERDATRAAVLAAEPGARLIEFGDGAVNHALHPVPVRHGFVFAGDAGSLAALQDGRLLRHAAEQGFRVLTSYEYLTVPPGAETWSPDQVRTFLAGSFLDERVRGELDAFDLAMIHVWRPAPDAPGVPFIRLTPR